MGRPRKDAEQPPLIEVEPENMKPILNKARAYLRLKGECGELNEKAKKALNALREAIVEADLQPLDATGVRRFRCGDHIIELTPQSEKVKIKDVKNGDDEDGDAGEEDDE